MTDWKEVLITDYIKLQRKREALEQERAEDQEIKNVESTMKKVADTLSELERPYNDKIVVIEEYMLDLYDAFIARWDIVDKTFDCGVGTVTLRTTKSLNIVDKKGLINVLLNIDKLPEAIRSWNLSYLRKLKDIDMIEDTIAHYEEHQNVVIKGAEDK